MALLSELVALCEANRVDTRATLNVFARRLREAGRISQAGRGRGAAHMTFLDGARFLIAAAATDQPERAADAEFEFSNTLLSSEGPHSSTFLDAASAPTLDVALARVLEALANESLDNAARERRAASIPGHDFGDMPPSPIVWLIVHRSGVQAQLRVLDEVFWYQHRALIALTDVGTDRHLTDRAKDYEHAVARFRSGKNLRAELDQSLFRAVAGLIGGPRA
ncbi:MAG TPA: hypothetical protein VF695_00500 [Sphingomonas sp.]|jgi:hypothetical protein